MKAPSKMKYSARNIIKMIVGAYEAKKNNKHTGHFLCPHFTPEIVDDLCYYDSFDFCEAIAYIATSEKFSSKHTEFWKQHLLRIIEGYFKIGMIPQNKCGYIDPRIRHTKRVSFGNINKSYEYRMYTDRSRNEERLDLEERLKKSQYEYIANINATIKHYYPEIWNKYNNK